MTVYFLVMNSNCVIQKILLMVRALPTQIAISLPFFVSRFQIRRVSRSYLYFARISCSKLFNVKVTIPEDFQQHGCWKSCTKAAEETISAP